MSTPTTKANSSGAQVLCQQARVIRDVVSANTAGVSHEESLQPPPGGGNCVNWVLGHLVHTCEQAVTALGLDSVRPPGSFLRYRRGSAPLTDDTEATGLPELLIAFQESSLVLENALASFDDERLERSVDPWGNGRPTRVGDYLAIVLFHQSYHAGQLGLLRRTLGKEGAIN